VGLTLHLHAKNKAARPESYEVRKSKRGHLATTASNIMHVSGLIVLAFVVLHLIDFRFDLRMPGPVGEEPAERTLRVLHDPITASVYVIGSLLLGYHLLHGFLSAFQSLGVEHPRAVRAARVAGIAFAALVAVGFASFPLWANLLK
jgi:succinate dehydrogenase / fumarate reductase cytochrome b subunit